MTSPSSAVTTDNQFFTFAPIDPESALSRFAGKYGRDYVLWGYQDWLDAFSNRSDVFYRSQLDRMEDRLYVEFCNARGLDSRVDLYEHDEDYSEDYHAFTVRTEWERCASLAASALGYVDILRTQYRLEKPFYPQADGFNLFIAEMKGLIKRPSQITAWLWEQWFSAATDVPPEEREELVALPYADYLKTSYWRRKRAAMLIVHRVRCMSARCIDRDSWVGGEFDLHVHHLHYKTLGREQLSDLYLLCKECHQRWHAGERDLVSYPQFNLVI